MQARLLRAVSLPLACAVLAACAADPEEDAGAEEDASELRASEAQRRQAQDLASMVTFLRQTTAWHGALDWAALARRGRSEIYRGDGSERAFYGALFRAFVAVPQGHQGLYLQQGCGSTVPLTGHSMRGVCGRPHARGIVVTQSRTANALGLAPGDLVVRVGAARGRAVLDAFASRPMCVTSRPNASFRDAEVSGAFADLLAPGEEIEVEAPNGTRRVVRAPTTAPAVWGPDTLSCRDPLGRDLTRTVSATMRRDGIGVIRLPGFTDLEVPWPEDPNAIGAYEATFEAKIGAAFAQVARARAIVWDVRGNGGGLTRVGLRIAAGFPGARPEPLSACRRRIPGTTPPAFTEDVYAVYALQPGGPYAFRGKVAILTDGLNYSAADYFPLAAKTRTNALLVGSTTAGGFGASGETRAFAGPPGFSVTVDPNLCFSLDDGLPLEGRGVVPHVEVDYAPADLAAGRDTVLERAVAELSR